MKLSIHFNRAGDPCLGIFRGRGGEIAAEAEAADFTGLGFPVLFLDDDIDFDVWSHD